MHERAFKVTMTYTFPCMIFSLCRSAGVPIWHVDQLKTPMGTIDVGLISMRWRHAEGPVQSFPNLLMLLLIR